MTFRRNWFIWLQVLICLGFILIISWNHRSSETGWQPFIEYWRMAVCNALGIDHLPLNEQDPEDQAKFWLREVGKLESTIKDPEVLCGAAWVLDAPENEFVSRYISIKQRTLDLGFQVVDLGYPYPETDWNQDAIHQQHVLHEEQCGKKCWELTESAVRLEPESVDLWRARAMLLIPKKLWGLGDESFEPRMEDWRTALKECQEHDPENALYDYLTATWLWGRSLSTEWDPELEEYVVIVKDQDLLDEANTAFERGLRRRFLKTGWQFSNRAALSFLKRSSSPPHHHYTLIGSRQISARVHDLLRNIHSRLHETYKERRRDPDAEAARQQIEKLFHVLEQYAQDEDRLTWETTAVHLRMSGYALLRNLDEEFPELFQKQESEKIRHEGDQYEIQLQIWGELNEREKEQEQSSTPLSWARLFVLATSPIAVTITALIALFVVLIGWFVGTDLPEERAPLRWIRHLMIWLVSFAISFLLLGIVSGKTEPEYQKILQAILLWSGYSFFFLMVLWVVRKSLRLAWKDTLSLFCVTLIPALLCHYDLSLRDLLVDLVAKVHVLILFLAIGILGCVGIGLFLLCRLFFKSSEVSTSRKVLAPLIILMVSLLAALKSNSSLMQVTIPIGIERWIGPSAGIDSAVSQLPANDLKGMMKLDDSFWIWSWFQWVNKNGSLWMIVLALLLTIGWHAVCQMKLRNHDNQQHSGRSQKRGQLRFLCFELGRSCIAFSLTVLLVWLSFIPQLMAVVEEKRKEDYQVIFEPENALKTAGEKEEEIRNDRETMKKIMEKVDERKRDLEERRRRDREWERKKKEEQSDVQKQIGE